MKRRGPGWLAALVVAVAVAAGVRAAGKDKAAKPEQLLLWPKGAPGAVGTTDKDKPTLTVYLPPKEKRNGIAVVVCPGGGYGFLADTYEGNDVASWLNERGTAAFVLRYRLGPRYRHPAPLQDAQRALRMVRAGAKKWRLIPTKVGIWGFSAGGHLASTAATKFDDGRPDTDDPIERQGCRPDFAILAYPVISLVPPYWHEGSRRNLLGDKPDPKLVESLCSDRQVTKRTPPTFLFHTNEDRPVPAENSVLFYLALRKAGVPAEMHIYERGGHGAGLALKHPALSSWTRRLESWLLNRGLLPPRDVKGAR
jgi:acetyl esterase/lipase